MLRASCATRSRTRPTPATTRCRVARVEVLAARHGHRLREEPPARGAAARVRRAGRLLLPGACAAARTSAGTLLYGFNGVYLASLERWIALDARGNQPGLDAQFSTDEPSSRWGRRRVGLPEDLHPARRRWSSTCSRATRASPRSPTTSRRSSPVIATPACGASSARKAEARSEPKANEVRVARGRARRAPLSTTGP